MNFGSNWICNLMGIFYFGPYFSEVMGKIVGMGRYQIFAETPILAFASTANTRILDLADCKP